MRKSQPFIKQLELRGYRSKYEKTWLYWQQVLTNKVPFERVPLHEITEPIFCLEVYLEVADRTSQVGPYWVRGECGLEYVLVDQYDWKQVTTIRRLSLRFGLPVNETGILEFPVDFETDEVYWFHEKDKFVKEVVLKARLTQPHPTSWKIVRVKYALRL